LVTFSHHLLPKIPEKVIPIVAAAISVIGLMRGLRGTEELPGTRPEVGASMVELEGLWCGTGVGDDECVADET
jgi:hypothetical protein